MDGPKHNGEFTHFIAIDFGTYGCGMAVSTNVDPDDIHIYSNWVQSKMAVKCPTALLLNDEGEFEAFGDHALYTYETKHRLRRPNKADQYYFFYRFKMCLYNKVPRYTVTNMLQAQTLKHDCHNYICMCALHVSTVHVRSSLAAQTAFFL